MPAIPAYRALIDAVTRLQRVQREAATELARELDCPRAAMSLLWLLDKRGETGIGDIAQLLHVDISVASRQVSALVDSGLAERTTPDGPGTDRRVRTVRLTDRGREFTAGTKHSMDARAAAVFSDWTTEDLALATAQIERVADTVSGLVGPSPAAPAGHPAPDLLATAT